MKVKVKLSESLAAVVGKEIMEVANVNSTEALNKLLTDKYPELKKHSYKISVNRIVPDAPQLLEHGDEVEFISE
jgi:molybdopterin converting factor small subunit